MLRRASPRLRWPAPACLPSGGRSAAEPTASHARMPAHVVRQQGTRSMRVLCAAPRPPAHHAPAGGTGAAESGVCSRQEHASHSSPPARFAIWYHSKQWGWVWETRRSAQRRRRLPPEEVRRMQREEPGGQAQLPYKPEDYAYSVMWSEEDQAYVGRVAECASLAAHGPSPALA